MYEKLLTTVRTVSLVYMIVLAGCQSIYHTTFFSVHSCHSVLNTVYQYMKTELAINRDKKMFLSDLFELSNDITYIGCLCMIEVVKNVFHLF